MKTVASDVNIPKKILPRTRGAFGINNEATKDSEARWRATSKVTLKIHLVEASFQSTPTHHAKHGHDSMVMAKPNHITIES